MNHEVQRSRGSEFDWRVEAVDEAGEGEIYVAVFTGSLAQERAQEYADWKNGKLLERL